MSILQANARIQNFRTSLTSPLEKAIGTDGIKAAKIITVAVAAMALLSCIRGLSSARLVLGGVSIATGFILKPKEPANDSIDLTDDSDEEEVGIVGAKGPEVIEIDDDAPDAAKKPVDISIAPANILRAPEDSTLCTFVHEEVKPKLASGALVAPSLLSELGVPEYDIAMSEKDWANDELCNGYIKVLSEQLVGNSKIAITNSFFLNNIKKRKNFQEQLLRLDKSLHANLYTPKGLDGSAPKAVRKELKYGKLEQIYIPVNAGKSHWFFMRVDLLSKEIHVFDSIRKSDYSSHTKLLKTYLNGLETRLERTLPDMPWKTVVNQEYPQQRGGCDCGFFTMRGMHKDVLDPTVSLNQDHLRMDVLRVLSDRQRKDIEGL